MPLHHDLMHQRSRLIEYKDEMRSAMWKSYKILREFFPDIDTQALTLMMKILDTEFKPLIEEKVLESI